MIIHSVAELIGNTPLFDVSSLLPPGCGRLLAKLEMFNPGGSVKDRPALAMIQDAEERGVLRPGMTIVEATAGNTGIGIALAGKAKGYRTVFYVPDRMSAEKIATMRLYGATVHLIPKELGMDRCVSEARRYVADHAGAVTLGQFENPANPSQAETILGPEIRNQLGYYPDGIAIGAGTGGTFTGLTRWLKKNHDRPACWLVQPEGSVFKGAPRKPYLIEGIGNTFVPEILDLSLADRIVDIPDRVSFRRCRQLAREVGLLAAGSSGANLEAAIQLAQTLGEGKTVVTVFADHLERYLSKDWVRDTFQV